MTEVESSKPDVSVTRSGNEKHPPRRAGFRNVFAAIRHIHQAPSTPGSAQRVSDLVSLAVVGVCILSLLGAVALPVEPTLKLLPLVFTVGAVVFYIINRLGIMLSLTSRQALIVWQIMIAAFWLGVTSSMLVMMCCYIFLPK